LDGNEATRWTTDRPQAGDEWIELAFEQLTDVAHVRLSMGSSLYVHPRQLVVEGSDDGQTYTELYRGHGFPGFMLGLVHEPDSLPVEVGLPPNRSQILRFRQTGRSPSFYWSIHDLHLWTR
ncbi:MAG: discoidin domain-containing protein, partial [Vicinamibacterales bacterium]|nr:discoidin domain-containing protein [Vicinamibacterales bacterium]